MHLFLHKNYPITQVWINLKLTSYLSRNADKQGNVNTLKHKTVQEKNKSIIPELTCSVIKTMYRIKEKSEIGHENLNKITSLK